ncbi:hypothetical protein XU18_0396 [Perkinsela sp. CCAP 1560/4]|nr:hypothetical protein XU18_0396 [Perkinsela sp. CCAP 1560/4]|eukprot:KNH09711.1 hypothetical protein XU18_0396 [Perkinsela sp. CCAP 1560/4]
MHRLCKTSRGILSRLCSVGIAPVSSDEKASIPIESKRLAAFQHVWKLFHRDVQSPKNSPESLAVPPTWLVNFCYEAQHSDNSATEQREIDYESIERFIQETNPSYRSALASASRLIDEVSKQEDLPLQADHPADYYLDHKIRIFPEEMYQYQAYDETALRALPDSLVEKLCLNSKSKKYLQIGQAYAFPNRAQLPTSWGTEPCKLLVDPADPTPILYVQLSAHFPPAAWIPVRLTLSALQRVLTEFAQFASTHREAHHEKFVQRWSEAKTCLVQQKMISASALRAYDETKPNLEKDKAEITSAILRYVGWMANTVPFHEAPIREFPNSQEFFCGEYEYPESFMEYLENCPFFFAIPELRTNSKDLWGQADGPGVAMSAFRCIFSKTVIWVKVHFSTEVKLPPTDPTLFKKLWKEQGVYPSTVTPVFIRVVWPDNVKMCGGGGLLMRLNSLLGSEFARDMPIDAAMAMVYCTAWAGRQQDLMGVRKMRLRLSDWEHKVKHGTQDRRPDFGAYPGTSELPSPMYTDKERLGMHLQYLAHLGDPDIETVIRRWMGYDSGAIRLGCAKAALESGNADLFLEIVRTELPGRFRKTMLRCYRSRKKRDLYDKIPRLNDEDFGRIGGGRLRPVSLQNMNSEELDARMRLESDPVRSNL